MRRRYFILSLNERSNCGRPIIGMKFLFRFSINLGLYYNYIYRESCSHEIVLDYDLF